MLVSQKLFIKWLLKLPDYLFIYFYTPPQKKTFLGVVQTPLELTGGQERISSLPCAHQGASNAAPQLTTTAELCFPCASVCSALSHASLSSNVSRGFISLLWSEP